MLAPSRLLWAAALLGVVTGCGVIGSDQSSSAETNTLCGNGTLDPGEDCDDGNQVNLDGCDSQCHFEQIQRATSVNLLFKTDSLCAHNVLGSAIGSLAQSNVQSGVAGAVKDGSLSAMFDFRGLPSLTGADGSFQVGWMMGTPVAGGSAAYDGTKDLDGWYSVSPTEVDSDRNPTALLSATITSDVLTATAPSVSVALTVSGSTATLTASSVAVTAHIGAASAPTPAASGSTRTGVEPSQHLDPSLTSFATLTQGELCGGISAASLATMHPPSDILSGGSFACSEGYNTSNSMLDVFVGGCSKLFVTIISSNQPDQVDPTQPVLGAGGPYKLKAGTGKKVASCTDKSGAAVDLTKCLATAAYSGAVQFTAQRAIVTSVQ